MFKIGDQVCHKYFPEEYGLGIIQNVYDESVTVMWENEFGSLWVETVDISDIE